MLGLFDSGLGGLTVAAAIAQRLPDVAFSYLGDQAHAPYGGRTPQEILDLTTRGVNQLFGQGCQLVVLACNTASVTALRDIQQEWLPRHWPGRNVLGVVVPVVEAMSEMLPDHTPRPAAPTVQVFATDHTVRSNVFVTEIYKRAPAVRVVQTACLELVSAIEGSADRQELTTLVQRDVDIARAACAHPDYVILGCTHYALIQDLFAVALPGIRLIHQAEAVAMQLGSYLLRHPEYPIARTGQRFFQTTGNTAAVNRAARLYAKQLGLKSTFTS